MNQAIKHLQLSKSLKQNKTKQKNSCSSPKDKKSTKSTPKLPPLLIWTDLQRWRSTSSVRAPQCCAWSASGHGSCHVGKNADHTGGMPGGSLPHTSCDDAAGYNGCRMSYGMCDITATVDHSHHRSEVQSSEYIGLEREIDVPTFHTITSDTVLRKSNSQLLSIFQDHWAIVTTMNPLWLAKQVQCQRNFTNPHIWWSGSTSRAKSVTVHYF